MGRNFPEIKEYLIRSIILTCVMFPIGALPLIFSILTITSKNNGDYANANSYSQVAYVSSTILLIFLAVGALFFAVIFFIPLLFALIGIAAGVA